MAASKSDKMVGIINVFIDYVAVKCLEHYCTAVQSDSKQHAYNKDNLFIEMIGSLQFPWLTLWHHEWLGPTRGIPVISRHMLSVELHNRVLFHKELQSILSFIYNTRVIPKSNLRLSIPFYKTGLKSKRTSKIRFSNLCGIILLNLCTDHPNLDQTNQGRFCLTPATKFCLILGGLCTKLSKSY